MARYEHLPIYREAYDLTVYVEQVVRNFSRYHKYTLGTDLRNRMRAALEKIVEANNATDRVEYLKELRQQLEGLKVLCRLCHDSSPFLRLARRSPSRGDYPVLEGERPREPCSSAWCGGSA